MWLVAYLLIRSKPAKPFPPSGWSTGSVFVKKLSHFVATVGVVIKDKLQAISEI